MLVFGVGEAVVVVRRPRRVGRRVVRRGILVNTAECFRESDVCFGLG